jgi:hypothetical protein
MIKVNTAILLMTVVGLTIGSFSFQNVQAQNPITCQTNALIGYGGIIFGVANVCTDGYTINVDLATDYLPNKDWVFNAWLVDDQAGGSGYSLVMGKVLESGTLQFSEVMTNARTYTDIVVTQQPADSLSPLPSWSNSVAATWLAPPFGQ